MFGQRQAIINLIDPSGPGGGERGSRLLLIAWAPSSPTFVDLASIFGGRVVYLNVLFGKRWAAPFRYIFLGLRTFHVLVRTRPVAVFAQNPPIFCPLAVIFGRHSSRFKLIIDHHAVWSIKSIREPFLSQAISILERFVVKRVDGNITPNENWTRDFREMGARNVFTYHDYLEMKKPVSSNNASVLSRLPQHQFLVVAAHGGHPEELLEEEVSALRGLDNYLLVITGRREKIAGRLARLNMPHNVTYAGYLGQDDYEELKREADVALSLSREPNTVPHAVHEFLSCRTPTVVMKDDLLRSIFDGALIEADDSSPEAIRALLRRTCEDSVFRATLLDGIDRNYERRTAMHQDEILELRELLSK